MSLRRDTLWNIAGMGLPLLAAIAFIPFTLGRLGAEAFGVVTLIWALIGYFGLFDLGMGRALTFQISKLRAEGQENRVKQTLNAGLLVTFLAGVVGGLALLAIAPQLSSSWLKISPEWQKDAQLAFQIAALGVIPTTVSSGLRGALEGFQRFAASNLVRLFYGLCMFGLPAISIWLHGNRISYIALYLVIARVAIVIAGFVQLWSNLHLSFTRQDVSAIKPLLSFGFWVTISGIVGPMMIYGDRFFVGVVVGADQLPFYAIPQEGLQRLLIIPGALCAALLPRLSSIQGHSLNELLSRSYRQIAASMFFACLAAGFLGYPILSWWISPSFAEKANPIVWVLAIGVWINSLAQVPYTLIHALGQPKLTAFFHIFELVLYFIILYWLATKYGLLGAAIAWLARVLIDLALLQFASIHLLRKIKHSGIAR